MRSCLGLILVCVTALFAVAETSSSSYEPGTIMVVKAHQSPGQTSTDITQYDVSVRIGNTTYVVPFTPPNGSNTVKYAVGQDLLVLVGSDTLTFNAGAAGKTEVPILSRETISADSVDVSKAPGEYFSMKLQHLREKLLLTPDQRDQVRPILEQEAGEVGEIWVNPSLSRPDNLKRYEKIVHASDEKIKPLLTAEQVQNLQELRKELKQEVKSMIAEQKSNSQN